MASELFPLKDEILISKKRLWIFASFLSTALGDVLRALGTGKVGIMRLCLFFSASGMQVSTLTKLRGFAFSAFFPTPRQTGTRLQVARGTSRLLENLSTSGLSGLPKPIHE